MTDAISVRDIKRLAENDSTAVAARILALLNNFQDKLAMVADNTALKAIGSADRADKFLAFKEDSLQLFAFDSTSVAGEALGPPATVVAPTGIGTGAGRWIALTLGGSAATKSYVDTQDTAAIASALATLNTRLRSAANAAAVKALDVTTLADKCLVYVEDLRQMYGYDAESTALDVTGVSVKPTTGVGAYVALTSPAPASATAADLVWFTSGVASALGAGVDEPAAADGSYANSHKEFQRCPTKGTLSLWMVAKEASVGVSPANTVIFQLIKSDGTILMSQNWGALPFPSAGVPTLLGTCSVAEGDMVGWEFVNGAAVQLPSLNLQFDIRATA